MNKYIIIISVIIASSSVPVRAQTNQERVTSHFNAAEYRVDAITLARFSPRARADLVAAILQQWALAEAAEINTTDRVHHLISQMATETGGLRIISENMNYSSTRLLKVFPRRVTPEQATNLAHKPILIANHVYGGRLGNKYPNDGWDFRGSGLIQLTGRGNFLERGNELGLPFADNPEMVRTPATAFSAAIAYWKARRLNLVADRGDLRAVRQAINGGTNGLPEAGVWLARAKRYLRASSGRDAESQAEEAIAVEQTLRSLGYLQNPRSGERNAPEDMDGAVKSFQRSRGIAETGRVDEDTLYELVDPDNFRNDAP